MSSTTVTNAGQDAVIPDHEVHPSKLLVYDTDTGTWHTVDAIGGKQIGVGLSWVHQKLHEGRFFSGGYLNPAVANGGTVDILFQTGAAGTFHGMAEASSSGDAVMTMYEGVTFSAAGTAVTMTNHNRNSLNVMTEGVTHTPTITGLGTQLNGPIFVPGGKATGSGGTGGFSEEFILKSSTAYLLRITNTSGVAQQVGAIVKGYLPTL